MSANASTDRQLTEEAAGELRQRLREEGWSSDMGWLPVGVGSAPGASRAAGGTTRRTVAHLPSVRAIDGGAPRVWKDGDVAVPSEADAREVMVAETEADDWQPETFEVPPEQVFDPEDADASDDLREAV